jgi:hypothetical protein
VERLSGQRVGTVAVRRRLAAGVVAAPVEAEQVRRHLLPAALRQQRVHLLDGGVQHHVQLLWERVSANIMFLFLLVYIKFKKYFLVQNKFFVSYNVD